MNRRIPFSITLIASLALLLGTGTAMGQTEEQIERFNQERKKYFTEKLELTEPEAKAFWPLYNDYSNRKMKIAEEERNTFMYSHQNAENLSEKEISEILDKIHRLKGEAYELEREYYHTRFPSVLTPRKVLKLYKVEWDFRRHLIKEIRGGEPGGERTGGEGPPEGQGNRHEGPGGGPAPMMAPTLN
jgi:hypothetical protein